MITSLLKQHLEVLTSDKSTEDSKPSLLKESRILHCLLIHLIPLFQ